MGGVGHHSVLHGSVDELNLVEAVHCCCTKDLIVGFADVICYEFHFGEITDDVDIIPSFGNSGEDEGVVELPSPEKGDIVDWELLSSDVKSSN